MQSIDGFFVVAWTSCYSRLICWWFETPWHSHGVAAICVFIPLSVPLCLLQGIGFGEFTLHMLPGSVIACFAAYGLLRFIYRRKELLRSPDPPEVAGQQIGLGQHMEEWTHTAKTLGSTSMGHQSDVKMLDWCLIDVDVEPRVFAIWEQNGQHFSEDLSQTKLKSLWSIMLILLIMVLNLVACDFGWPRIVVFRR